MTSQDKYAWLKSSNQNSELDCLIYSDSSPQEQTDDRKVDLLFKLLIQKMTTIHDKLVQ